MNASFIHHGIECSVKWAGMEMKPHNAGDEHIFVASAIGFPKICARGNNPEKAINRAKTELRRAIDIHFANRF